MGRAGKPKRKAKSNVSSLTPSQLARKRANDREAQRAIRARTKEHIDRLERELEELKSKQSRDQTVLEHDDTLFDIKMIELSGESDKQSRDTTRQLKDCATGTRMTTRKTTRTVPSEQKDQPTETYKSSGSSSSSDGGAMLQKSLELSGESRWKTRRSQEALKRQMEIARDCQRLLQIGTDNGRDGGTDDRRITAGP
ncbi:hypothetical protein FOWG_17191 [Fusarium oxysporum f. sp. lycopersici MN25]|nr:hypothetical protein FOWG_17191 [Fusarium oxysporum f. sp. lycopersici MN25]